MRSGWPCISGGWCRWMVIANRSTSAVCSRIERHEPMELRGIYCRKLMFTLIMVQNRRLHNSGRTGQYHVAVFSFETIPHGPPATIYT